MLHQGTERVPVEFIAVRHPTHELQAHHQLLLANALAQAQALMQGRSDAGGHRHFPGNRPTTFILLDALTPRNARRADRAARRRRAVAFAATRRAFFADVAARR